jgi:hypothetical protein
VSDIVSVMSLLGDLLSWDNSIVRHDSDSIVNQI